jgi:signal transduction histidine kinase
MARVLAEGTGALWSQVWLVVDGHPALAATWPPDAPGDAPVGDPDPAAPTTGRRSLPVRHGGELLAVLLVQEREHVVLSSVEERLFVGLAAQAGPVLLGARLRAELERRLGELAVRADELRRSRQRLVDLQDHERRSLERDIHDGAQQHLVALSINLRLAQTLAERSTEAADRLLAGQEVAAANAIDTLLRLSRGIYPTLLAERGLVAGLAAAVANSPVPVQLTDHHVGRYPSAVEAAAYFCCLEAVQNAVKHAGARSIRVVLDGRDGALTCTVDDDGTGFEPGALAVGSGLANMQDRARAVDGTVTVQATPSGGARMRARLPTVQVA